MKFHFQSRALLFSCLLLLGPAALAQHQTAAAYKASKGASLNHFYEKLLLLKDRMNTPTGRALAEPRHRFMEDFVAQFLEEWNVSA
jgi:uncharacterized protein